MVDGGELATDGPRSQHEINQAADASFVPRSSHTYGPQMSSLTAEYCRWSDDLP